MARPTNSAYTVVFAMALFSRCYIMAASSAIPTGQQDEGWTEQDFNTAMGGETMPGNSIGALATIQNPTWDSGLFERKKVFIITNFGLQSSDLLQAQQFPHTQEAGATSDEQINIKLRRGADEQIPKKTDMHNCMLGRMYRPCWQQ
ncbi:hypothetical protein COCON_G00115890 [Conger conger]|uniref:Melanin-concentrating hormone n=1 Tax=Conger conger TaxID=82655 RepID=A0A9Q1DFT6_CONCO|nr:pro-MCH [Conger conger]KAJ8268982.1 hypothetical protein COCON_G00115890 [Conger conger]